MRPSFQSLSFRLLLLTVFFVMLAEVLIYTPSVARFRQVYLTEKLDAAHLAAMAVTVSPDRMVSEEVTYELLDHVGAWSISVVRDGVPMEMLKRPLLPEAQAHFDLDAPGVITLIVDAFQALFQTRNRVLQIRGTAPKDPRAEVVVTLDEYPLRRQMYEYSWRIFNLSIVISAITAALLFVSLRWLMVRPLERLTASLVAFRRAPEDRSSDLSGLGRRDEIGVALREMAAMKEGLRSALRQRTRLAALGTAVNKISHDLRNMLSTATLISDRLVESQDPEVRRIAPTLVRAIDRAAALCSTTLNFTRETPPLRPEPVTLADLVREVEAGVPATELGTLRLHVTEGGELVVSVDRDQMFRAIANLIANAAGAGAGRVTISGRRVDRLISIDVVDDGPGIPADAVGKLFLPFQYSSRKDGTGLGLTIARDIVQAHGGRLTLERTGPDGTAFRMELPGES